MISIELKDKVLAYFVADGIDRYYNYNVKDVGKDMGISQTELAELLQEFQYIGLIEDYGGINIYGKFSLIVTQLAKFLVEQGGFAEEQSMKALNKEYLLLQVKALQAQCEQLEAEGQRLKAGDQTAAERILAAGANLATIAASIIQPIMKL